MKHAKIAAAALALTLPAGLAQAYTVIDDTTVWRFKQGGSNGTQWVDIIGPDGTLGAGDGFRTDKVDISWSGTNSNTLNMRFYTAFGATSVVNGASIGDLWFDANGNNSGDGYRFETGFAMGNNRTGSKPVGTLWDVSDWKTVDDVWGNVDSTVGAKYCIGCPVADTSPTPGTQPDTLSLIAAGTQYGTGQVGTVQNWGSSGNGGIDVAIVFDTNSQIYADFRDGFDFGWGTGDCGNDTIATPIPAALPLLGTAVAGLGLAAWRKRRAV